MKNAGTIELIKYLINNISSDGRTFNDTKFNFEETVKKLFNTKTKIFGIKLPYTSYFICKKTLINYINEEKISYEDNYGILKIVSIYKFLSQTPANYNYNYYNYIYTDINDNYDDRSFSCHEISNIINNKDCNEIIYALEKLFNIENIVFNYK